MSATAAVDSGSSKRVPQPVTGLDLRSLPLGPEEAFVFSRIDGTSSDAEIAAATGLSSAVVVASLERLHALGAIHFDGSTQPAPQPRMGTVAVTESNPASVADDDETADLDGERRALILRTHLQLAELNHYELLGVDPTADRKAIKATYFRVATVFHPDKYFGKNLGSYKAKLETIFARFTEAERTLSDSTARAEYDSYLARQRKTRDLERALGASAFGTVPKGTSLVQSPDVGTTTSGPPIPPGTSPRPVSISAAPAVPSQRSSSPPSEQRKRALARKLLGGAPPARWSQQMSAVQPSERPPVSSGADELRRLYEQRAQATRNAKVEEHLQAAAAALGERKPVEAAAQLRSAEALGPTDTQVVARIETVRQRLAEEMADSYLEQARYEERAGRLTEAAVSYQKAAAGKPSAASYSAAARCLLESAGDLHRAADLARKAVGLAPNDAQYRLVLARVFTAAGMRTSALNTLEQASGLAPDDTNIRDWLRRLRRKDP